MAMLAMVSMVLDSSPAASHGELSPRFRVSRIPAASHRPKAYQELAWKRKRAKLGDRAIERPPTCGV